MNPEGGVTHCVEVVAEGSARRRRGLLNSYALFTTPASFTVPEGGAEEGVKKMMIVEIKKDDDCED